MKKILSIVMFMLCITATTMAAESKGDKMTTRGTEFILNSVNQDIEIKPGITAGMWANVIKTYAGKKFPSASFETVWANSVKKTGKLIVFNTYWKNGRAQVTMLDTIYTTYYEYNGEVWLVEECGQPIGSDPGMITNAIREGLAAGQMGNNNFKNNKEMGNTMDINVNFKGAEAVAQQTNNGMAPWLIALIIVGGLILIAMILYFISRRDGMLSQYRALNNFRGEVIGDHYREVRGAINFNGEFNQHIRTENAAWNNNDRPR